MNVLVEQIMEAGYAGRILTEKQLAVLIGGSKVRRYGLVNRALKDGTLHQLKRGLCTLASHHSSGAIHPFITAQAILPGSYISFETALSHHGWIPEAVFTTASVTPKRKTLTHQQDNFGSFTYHPLAIHRYQFLTQIKRARFGKQYALLAKPLRAMMDLVAYRKLTWTGLGWIEEGLRVERASLLALHVKDFEALRSVYKHKAAQAFLAEFECAVRDLKATGRKRLLTGERAENDRLASTKASIL
ncbi:MAG: hypothetical protein OXC63_12500 [Aestuariivita sp.]|nr:hypothetical protein [Aestuariivita sp.]MCY4346625.1 hypothetical protein [Aestuariivita sp.]